MIPRRYEFTHHLALWEELEDENDDHCCAAKMGGEPGPTGRAILFDTRNNKRGDKYYISTRQGKYKYAGVPVYISTQIKDRETCILLISQRRNKIT
jgi:hypothetical protein